MSDKQSIHEYQQRVLEQIKLDKYKHVLVNKDEWELMTDSAEISDYLPKSQHVQLQTSTETINLDTFSSISIDSKKPAHVFNTGGSIWGLDFCPKHPSNDRQHHIQYLAVGGYNTTTECHAETQITGEYRNAIQIWRCDMSAKGNSPLLDFCILHDYGVVADLKWCPLGSYKKKAEGRNWSKLGILSVLFGDGAVRIFIVPHPDSIREKEKQNNKKKKKDLETFYLKVCKPRLTFKLERSTISCQEWSGYLRLACGGRDGSITIFNIEHSLERQKPIVEVKIYYNGCSTISSISWYSILDSSVFISSDDQGFIYLHNLNDPYVPKSLFKISQYYNIVSWPGHRLNYIWTNTSSVLRMNATIDGRQSTALTMHNGHIWSIDTSANHGVVASCGSEGSVIVKTYAWDGAKPTRKKVYQHKIYRLTYDPSTNIFEYIEECLPEINPPDRDYHAILKDQTCSIQRVVWNPNKTASEWLASGGKSGLCRIDCNTT